MGGKMIKAYEAERIAKETIIEKMNLKYIEQGIITNHQTREFLFWFKINGEKNIWIMGHLITNTDGFIINFYHTQILRNIEKKNYSETLTNAIEKIKKLNNCQEFERNGKNILRFNINYHDFPASICIQSIINIGYKINEARFQKEFQEKLQEIIDIIKKKWPYDLLE